MEESWYHGDEWRQKCNLAIEENGRLKKTITELQEEIRVMADENEMLHRDLDLAMKTHTETNNPLAMYNPAESNPVEELRMLIRKHHPMDPDYLDKASLLAIKISSSDKWVEQAKNLIKGWKEHSWYINSGRLKEFVWFINSETNG